MKTRVLIVDDSATVRGDLRGVLGAAGFTTTLCECLASARRALEREAFSLIILDVLLPDGDGVDLLAQLRAEEHTARVPVLLLSTEAQVAGRLRGLGHGASDYVGKPYDASYVVKRACELTRVGEVSGEPRLVAAGRRRKLLLVDDSPTFRHAAQEELRRDGHDVIPAASGEEALALLRAQPVDCILMDLEMPGLSGIQTMRALRELPSAARTPVLVLTAHFNGRPMADALAAGADAFCSKSSDMELLRAQVRNVLRKRLPQAQPAPSSPPGPQAPAAPGPDSLFDQVVAHSGLSPVIGKSTIARACQRAGVDSGTLTPEALGRALPALRETLRVFLSEEEMQRRLSSIEALARPNPHALQLA